VRFYRSFSLRMNDYAPQMIVKTPSPWHVLATQNSAAQTPRCQLLKCVMCWFWIRHL